MRKKIGLLVLLMFLCVASVFVLSVCSGPISTSTEVSVVDTVGPPIATPTPLPTDTPIPPTATPTPVPTAPPLEEMQDTVQSMTEVQWKRYLENLDGTMIEDWTGWVANVDKEILGSKYQLFVDMDSPDDTFSTYDVYFYIPDEMALVYNKGQQVTFSGRIKSVTELLGKLMIRLEDVTVEVNK